MMRVFDTHVDVKNPARVEAIIVYRSEDDSLSKLHISHFGPINHANIEAARSYVRTFRIGDPE
jgi:hypothetical protein